MDITKLSKEELLKVLEAMPSTMVEEAASSIQLPPSQIEQLSVELIHIMLCTKKEDCAFMLEMMMDGRWEQEDHLIWREETKKVLENYELSYEDVSDNYGLILSLIQTLKETPIAFDLIRMIKDCDEASGFISNSGHKIKGIGEV